MKKSFIAILFGSLTSLAWILCAPACSDDDDDDDSDAVREKYEYQGVATYAGVAYTGCKATISLLNNGQVNLSVSTSIPYLSPSFADVTLSSNGDTSCIKAQNQTFESGLDKTSVLTVSGLLFGNRSMIDLVIVGSDLHDTLFFSNKKPAADDVPTRQDSSSSSTSSDPVLASYLGSYSGRVFLDGADSSSALNASLATNASGGSFSLSLLGCSFSSKMPKMDITLSDVAISASGSLSASMASYSIMGTSASIPVSVSGSVSNGNAITLKLDMQLGSDNAHSLQWSGSRN